MALLWITTAVLASFLFLSPWVFSHYGYPKSIELAEEQTDSAAGLKAFATRWQINDLSFSVIYENVLPDSNRYSSAPWYSVIPNRWRESLAHLYQQDQDNKETITAKSFLIARAITLLIWLLIVAFLMKRIWQQPTGQQLVHQLFLALAWFWILAPTQNPWYWTWALPFLLPSHRRAWLGMSCVLFAYYVRFPLLYFEVEGIVPGTNISAWAFFSDFVVWIEFFPLMLWILFYNRTNKSCLSKDTINKKCHELL